MSNGKLILVAMCAEDCPIQPVAPGNWWLGYAPSVNPLSGVQMSYDDLDSYLTDLKTKDMNVMLQNSWMLLSRVIVSINSQDPHSMAVAAMPITRIFPILEIGSITGEDISVPVTNWVLLKPQTVTEYEKSIETIGQQILMKRSGLSIARPGSMPAS